MPFFQNIKNALERRAYFNVIYGRYFKKVVEISTNKQDILRMMREV